MKLTIHADDKMAHFILNATGLDLIIRYKLIYIHMLGNENQKRLAHKIALRYANQGVELPNSKRVLHWIYKTQQEIRDRCGENMEQINIEL